MELIGILILAGLAFYAGTCVKRKDEEEKPYPDTMKIGAAMDTLYAYGISMLVARKYGAHLQWRYFYKSIGRQRCEDETTCIVVTLLDGTERKENFQKKDICRYAVKSTFRMDFTKEEATETVALDPVDEWILSHVSDIEIKISEALKEERKYLTYPVEESIRSCIDEIARRLYDRTSYFVLVNNDELVIDFQLLY
jgi:hypothetical protein